MDILKDAARILFALAAIAAAVWLWMKLMVFLDAWGVHLPLRRGDPRHEPSKVEIQTLFHGNAKDEDQI